MALIVKPSGERRRKAALATAVLANWSTVSMNISLSRLRDDAALINVPLIAALGGEPGEIGAGGGRLHAAFLGDDVGEAAIDIARHPLGVAADVEMRAILEPGPEFAAVF